MIKYRVSYYESDSWSTDHWHIDYNTEQEARNAYQECYNEFMGKAVTPSYYIRPTYVGAIEV